MAAEPRDDYLPRAWVHRIAYLMDEWIKIPGTSIRFGLDSIIGVIPGVGDTVTFVIGLAMLKEASRLNLPLRTHAVIVRNLVIDWFAGLLPGVDLVLDTAIKAHLKNARLLTEAAKRRHTTSTPGAPDPASIPAGR